MKISDPVPDVKKDSKQNEKWTFRWQVAGPSQDPFLLIDFENDATAVLFDCGIRVWGKVKTILKVDHLCISHAHIDHLIGFDHIIRSLLGENKTLNIHGPQGITGKLYSKLAGYDWDKSAEQELVLHIHEYHEKGKTKEVLACNKQFSRTEKPQISGWNGQVVNEKKYSVYAVPVPHGGSPCLAYALIENDMPRVDKEYLMSLGQAPGPWIGELLRNVQQKSPESSADKIMIGNQLISRQQLLQQLIRVQPGRKMVYITDTVYSQDWVDHMLSIVQQPDIVVCESTFLESDARLANIYHHLTSVQAAKIARQLQAKKLLLFHISSRYHPNLFQAVLEARKVFPNTDMARISGKNGRRHNGKKRLNENRTTSDFAGFE